MHLELLAVINSNGSIVLPFLTARFHERQAGKICQMGRLSCYETIRGMLNGGQYFIQNTTDLRNHSE